MKGKPGPKRIEPPPDVASFIIRGYRTGLSIDGLAVVTGYSNFVVRRALLNSGVELRKPGRPRGKMALRTIPEQWKKAYRMREKGYTFQKIADALGASVAGAWLMVEKADDMFKKEKSNGSG